MSQPGILSDSMFDSLLADTSDIGSKPYSREHIFYAILTYCEAREEGRNRLDMFYYHDLIKKMVASIRAKRMAEARYQAGQASAFDMQLSTVARDGMDALLFPALALLHLADREYGAACDKLNLSLAAIGNLYEAGCKEAIFAALEQRLNMFRLFAAEGNIVKTAAAAVDLIDFLYSRRQHALFMNVNLFEACERDDYAATAAHYTDEVLIKLCALGNGNYLKVFLGNLRRKMEAWPASSAKDAFLVLLACMSILDVDWTADGPPPLTGLPFSLRYLVSVALTQSNASGADHERWQAWEAVARRHPAFERMGSHRLSITDAIATAGAQRGVGIVSAHDALAMA